MTTYLVRSEQRATQPTAVRRAELTVDDLPPWLSETFTRVPVFLAAHGSYPAGPPFARYHQVGIGRFQVEAGFPVTSLIEGRGDVHPATLPGGSVAITLHIGHFAEVAPGHQAVADWIAAHGGEPLGDSWEVYFSDPKTQDDPESWRTEIVQPYRVNAPATIP